MVIMRAQRGVVEEIMGLETRGILDILAQQIKDLPVETEQLLGLLLVAVAVALEGQGEMVIRHLVLVVQVVLA